ncbi:MAG: helix-hairpin-helix domain-containing protein [Bacteroidetes bacterium]|nr:helix-hairpin-helix domain-containing protein [Bacteroidota bacterium]
MKLTEIVKDYFSFTKKERVGALTLVALIILLLLAPKFFSSPKQQDSSLDFEQFKNEIAQLKSSQQDSNRFAYNNKSSNSESHLVYREPFSDGTETTPLKMFYFDPNRISEADWKSLGLRDKSIRTIRNYLSKGGKFRKAEDLKKIYGLEEKEYQRLLPFIKIENSDVKAPPEKREKENTHYIKPYNPTEIKPIDINQANEQQLTVLPGIGEKLAKRILGFREKLGGFYSVDQVGETYFLPDSTFKKINPFLKIGVFDCKKININQADAATLSAHPYINWGLANAIVQYRNQHGDYRSLQDLKNIHIITEGLFEKISHYLEN